MTKVNKEQKDGSLVVRISGTIEESTDLPNLLGPPAPEMEISCKEVSRINSVGVKHWITYFQKARECGSKVRFSEVSVPLVTQFNMISNFGAGGEVVSIYAPYSCAQCGAEFRTLFPRAELIKLGFEPPSAPCPKCGGTAQFDDIPEEYFAFLKD